MKLTNPTDDELNAAFAEKVCGWTRITEAVNVAFVVPETGARGTPPDFCKSADAVLPWLEKWPFRFESGKAIGCQYRVSLLGESDWKEWNKDGWYYGIAETFFRAAVIALLRAHGTDVEFTHA